MRFVLHGVRSDSYNSADTNSPNSALTWTGVSGRMLSRQSSFHLCKCCCIFGLP